MTASCLAEDCKTACACSQTVPADPERKRQRVEMSHGGTVPAEIAESPELLKDTQTLLPEHYTFEVPKTVWMLRKHNVRRVALQFPEGLLLFSIALKEILERHVPSLEDCVIMSDVAYGACCVDDLQAKALGCDYLVHYGHSCLVPLTHTCIKTLYVFVEIAIDVEPAAALIRSSLPALSKLALVGTIQFNSALHRLKQSLQSTHPDILIPQSRPLSAGEILGCTAPRLQGTTRQGVDLAVFETVVYVGDGRFHLESMMMANPSLAFYKYDPYTQVLSRETLDFAALRQSRQESMQQASSARRWGVLVGAIGRQGNPAIADRIVRELNARQLQHTLVVMDEEITEGRLAKHPDVEAWVQVACPRLSLDWGYTFSRPLLTPYEFHALFSGSDLPTDHLPMDYYANDTQGPWANYHPDCKDRKYSVENFV